MRHTMARNLVYLNKLGDLARALSSLTVANARCSARALEEG